jgi:hypothetical protein
MENDKVEPAQFKCCVISFGNGVLEAWLLVHDVDMGNLAAHESEVSNFPGAVVGPVARFILLTLSTCGYCYQLPPSLDLPSTSGRNKEFRTFNNKDRAIAVGQSEM